MRMGKYERELTAVLETARGERQVHSYLKAHADLVLRAFNTAWNAKYIVSEFKVGTDFRSDFLILSADSGSWHAIFIELESHRARLYHPNGRPTKTMQIAQRQVAEWSDHVRQFDTVLRAQFSKILERVGACSECSVAGAFGSGAEEIRDTRTYVDYRYHVVVGRSKYLSPEEQRYRQQDCQYWGGLPIATYDRLLHFARTTDAAYRDTVQHWKQSGMKIPSTVRRRYYGLEPALVV